MNPLASLAPALKDIASTQKTSFATTQAVWRFLNNENVSFQQLNQPLQKLALEQIALSNHHYALVAHDWSQLQYFKHNNKLNRFKRTHASDKGYELQSSLLIDAETGLPIAPLDQTLCDATGRYSTFTDGHKIKETHLNALCEQIEHIESLPIEKKLVHIIDREGDSIAHLRLLNQQEHLFLIRGKEGNRVEYQGEDVKLSEVSDQIPTTQTHTIQYKGNCEQLYVGETQISITRNARPMQKDETGKRVPPQKGKSLTVRLIVVEVKNKQGKSLSRWSLLSNVSSEIPSIELATWYYWRWKIENYFKLLKQAGHDIESWLQTTPQAILRRLLIASMACVLTWRIQRENDEKNSRVRVFLTRLSGRQQKRGTRESAPAILAGLSILLNTLQLLSEHSVDDLKLIAEIALESLQKDV